MPPRSSSYPGRGTVHQPICIGDSSDEDDAPATTSRLGVQRTVPTAAVARTANPSTTLPEATPATTSIAPAAAHPPVPVASASASASTSASAGAPAASPSAAPRPPTLSQFLERSRQFAPFQPSSSSDPQAQAQAAATGGDDSAPDPSAPTSSSTMSAAQPVAVAQTQATAPPPPADLAAQPALLASTSEGTDTTTATATVAPSPRLAAFISASKRAHEAAGLGADDLSVPALGRPVRKKQRSTAASSSSATPTSSSPAPPPPPTLSRTRSSQASAYDGLLHPFKPPLEPTAPLTIDDMIRESHRRFHPGGMQCPLVIGDQRCQDPPATGQILMMHIVKHIEKLRANPSPKPPVIYWIDQDGISSDPLTVDALERCAASKVEAMERSVCIFAGCEAKFKNGYGRTAHFTSMHPPPYSYDQLRRLNSLFGPPPPRPLPELPKVVPTWQLVLPPVRALARKPYSTTTHPILEERDEDDPFLPSASDRRVWRDLNDSSNFLYDPRRKEDEHRGDDESEAPTTQASQIPPTPDKRLARSRSGRGSPALSGGRAGLTTVSIRAGDVHPLPSDGNRIVRMPLTIRKTDTPLRVNLRPTGPDVILHKVRLLEAEIMRRKGEVPLPVEPVGTEAFLAENRLAGILDPAAASLLQKPPSQGKWPTPTSGPSSALPAPGSAGSGSATPPVVAGAPVPAGTKRKTPAHLNAEALAALRAEKEHAKQIERMAAKYAYLKTGAWIGYDFYQHKEAAIRYQTDLDRKAKAEAEAVTAKAETAEEGKHAGGLVAGIST